MEILIPIGNRLKEVREKMEMSQTEFAAIAEQQGIPGATRQSQANYEKGKQAPSAAYLAAIAAYGADVQYILTGIRANATAEAAANYVVLSKRETALLDNYRHIADDEDKKAVERTALIAARTSHKDETERQEVKKSQTK